MAFKPSEDQIALLKKAQSMEEPYLDRIGRVAEEAGLPKSTVYRWRKDPGFRLWWQEQAEVYMARQLPRVWAMILARSLGSRWGVGDHKDSRLFLERFDRGFKPTERQELQIETFEQILQKVRADKETAQGFGLEGIVSDADSESEDSADEG